MIFYRRIPRLLAQDLWMRRKALILIVSVVPILLAIGVLFNGHIHMTQSLKELVLSLRFEFFYSPLFLLMISVNLNPSEWVIIRRYLHRREIFVYEVCLIVLYAFFFTLVVMVSGTVVTFWLHQVAIQLSQMIVFALLFYLIIVTVGLLFTAVSAWSNKVFAWILVTGVVILDRYTLVILPAIFHGGASQQLSVLRVLVPAIVLLLLIIARQVKNIDYYSKDENH